MGPEDKEWYEAQFSMFESAGWTALQKDVGIIVKDTEAKILNGTSEEFDKLIGQFRTLVWFNNYETTTRSNFENAEEAEEDASI